MSIKLRRILRSVAKVTLGLTTVLLLGYVGYVTYLSVKNKPYKVRVSNVTDSAFTVSWVTDEPMKGIVYYGEKDNFLPGPLAWLGKKKAVDDRDATDAMSECVSKFNEKVSKTRDENFTVDASGFDCNNVKVRKYGKYYTHHVTVQNLEAEKEYFFRVGNGYISYKTGKTEGVEYIEREMQAISEFRSRTHPTIKGIATPNPAYGTSYNIFFASDGTVIEKKNFDSIIFLKTFKEGAEYPTMSSVVNADGGWTIDLSNIRESNGESLNMEDTYLEFIPQVDNTRPGASGTTKFEALKFPLNLMGNNVDDLHKDKDIEGFQTVRLLREFVGKSYAANCNCKLPSGTCRSLLDQVCRDRGGTCVASCSSTPPPSPQYPDEGNPVQCWKIGSCQYAVYENSCPAGYTPTKSECSKEPVSPPKPNPLCCTSGCTCHNRFARCPSGYTEYASQTACKKANEKETPKVSCCVPLGQSDCSCVTNREAGSCGGSYPQEYKTNSLSEAKALCKDKLPKVANNCYTYVKSNNTCAGPKTCTRGTLSFRECEDKRKQSLNVPAKTCCKVTGIKKVSGVMKADCSCEFNQSSCKSGYTEYANKNACEGNRVQGQPDEGENQVCEGRCVNGKKQYVVYKRGGGNVPVNMLTNLLMPLEGLFVKNSFASDVSGGDTGSGDYQIVPTEESCDNEGPLQELKETCTGSNCKKCWSEKDCFLVKVNQKDDCPENYKEGSVCQPDFSKLNAGKAEGRNIQMETVKKNCTNNGTLEPKRGVTMTVVSGNCEENCWAHYKNSDGSVCGNIQLDDSVYCENIYCSEKQKKTLTKQEGESCSGITCDHVGGCVCPEDCGGISVREGQSCELSRQSRNEEPSQGEGSGDEDREGSKQCCYKKVLALQGPGGAGHATEQVQGVTTESSATSQKFVYRLVDCSEESDKSFYIGVAESCPGGKGLTEQDFSDRLCSSGEVFNVKENKCKAIDRTCKKLLLDGKGVYSCESYQDSCFPSESSPKIGGLYKHGLCESFLNDLNGVNSIWRRCWYPKLNEETFRLQCSISDTLYKSECQDVGNNVGYTDKLYGNVGDCTNSLKDIGACLDADCNVIGKDKENCSTSGGSWMTYDANQQFCTPNNGQVQTKEPQEAEISDNICCFNTNGQLNNTCKPGDTVKLLVDSQVETTKCSEAIWGSSNNTSTLKEYYCLKEQNCKKTYTTGEQDQSCYPTEYGPGSCNEALGWNQGNFSKSFNPAKTFCDGCPSGVFYGPVNILENTTSLNFIRGNACILNGEVFKPTTACREAIEDAVPDLEGMGKTNIVYFDVACGSKWKGECLYHGYSAGRYDDVYDCCEFSPGYYGIVQRPEKAHQVQCLVDGVARNVVGWGYCKKSFFSTMYCAKLAAGGTLDVTAFFYPSEMVGLGCPDGREKVDGSASTVNFGGVKYHCISSGIFKRYHSLDPRAWGAYRLGTCVTDGGIHPGAVQGVSSSQVLGVTDGLQEKAESPVLYMPEQGIYNISQSGKNISVLSDGSTGVLLFKDGNGIPGYQAPKDPNNPREDEDILLDQSSVVLDISQKTSAKQYHLKKGINIISLGLFPSEGENIQLLSNRFLELVNQSDYKVSRISYFNAGLWAGGNTYDSKTGEVKGAPFPLSQGTGYVLIAERDTTISVPGYKTSTQIPIAFSSGWNLVGVHGHQKAYTAESFINSINSTKGLKADNVTWWPTSKGRYEGYQVSQGQTYGQDFPISPLNGYFVRITDLKHDKPECKSILWNPGGQKNEECGTQLN